MIILDNSVNKTLIHEAANCSSQLQEVGLHPVSPHADCVQHLYTRSCNSAQRKPSRTHQSLGARVGSVQKEPNRQLLEGIGSAFYRHTFASKLCWN